MSTNFRNLQQILNSLIKKYKLEEIIERSELIEKFEEVVGKQISSQAKIKDFQNGILKLEVENAVWKNEIFFLREQIIEKLNQAYGKSIVKQIVIL